MAKSFLIKMFGICEEITGKTELEIMGIQEMNSEDLLKLLKEDYPDLGKIDSLGLAVNHRYIQEPTDIKSDDEIALIPPVSGG